MKKRWQAYAVDVDGTTAMQIDRRGVHRSWWMKCFYNFASALEQAYWLAECWPEAWVDVCERNETGSGWEVRLRIMPVRCYAHYAPAMPCGCLASWPPCSLEHAVRMTGKEPCDVAA